MSVRVNIYKYTSHRVCDHTSSDTHTQSLYTTTNSTVTGAQTFCTNITLIEDGQLETDLGTIIKLLSIIILIQNNCSFFFRYCPCHVTQWLQQQIVLVNWTNETQVFILYFSAPLFYMNIKMQKLCFCFFSQCHVAHSLLKQILFP